MILVRTGEPASEPITLGLAADYAKTMAAESSLLSVFIASARDAIEEETGKALISQTWALYSQTWSTFPPYRGQEQSVARPYLSAYPASDYARFQQMPLPRSPLISIDSVKYYDAQGAQQTLAPASYTLKPSSRSSHGALVLAQGYDWPVIADRPDAVQITFTAGHTSAAAIPGKLRQALLLLVKFYNDNRDAVIAERGVVPVELPRGVKDLLTSERVSFVA